MTGNIYRSVILEQHVRLFRDAMGAEFLFMDDNSRPHRANIVDECLQSEDITRMDWPEYSPALNPIEHVKYNESRLVDHARFNDETDNENHNDEIINGESIPIYSFIVLKIFIYDGLSRGNCCYCEHIKDGPCFNGATSAQNC
ncbi:transposable element Tcb1 transposase [Trichonephila clavipes]|nr:transposable element Tcb1 transposase [Trichonephila clavipes]